MRNESINVGVIGTGGMGGRHVYNLTHEVAAAQVVALMDVDQARLQTVAAACGATHTFTDGNELINHPAVEAVLIAAPDRFHATLTHACIAAGKPVFCEKPLATSAAEAYIIEAREWVYSLQIGTASGPSAWDGYVAMIIADACVESAKSGQPVAIEIPEQPTIYQR